MATIHQRKTGGKFYASFKDRNGRWVLRSTGSTVKEDAKVIANDMESKERLVSRGLIDEQRLVPKKLFSEAVKEYETSLRAKNVTQKHIIDSIRILNRFARFAAPKYPADCTQTAIEKYLAHLQSAPRTKQKHLVVLRHFLKRYNVTFEKIEIKSQITKPRRMLSHQEWFYLRSFLQRPPRKLRQKEDAKNLAVTGPKRVNYKLLPQDRLLIYSLALQSCYRMGEIRSLKASDLVVPDSPDEPCFVTCTKTKNRKPAKQYIQRELALQLKGKLPLPMPDSTNTARMAKRDLYDARKFYEHECRQQNKEPEQYFLTLVNENGEQFTAHCFRHTGLSYLAMRNVPIPVLMRIARHSDPKLTLRTYGHIYPSSEWDAIRNCDWF